MWTQGEMERRGSEGERIENEGGREGGKGRGRKGGLGRGRLGGLTVRVEKVYVTPNQNCVGSCTVSSALKQYQNCNPWVPQTQTLHWEPTDLIPKHH